MVESQPSKLLVASSILVSRSICSTTCKDFKDANAPAALGSRSKALPHPCRSVMVA